MNHLAPEAPVAALVKSLPHLKGRELPELVRAARWRRKKRERPVEAEGPNLAQVMEAARQEVEKL